MRRILCQYQAVATIIQGLNTVFMLIHTFVKPPFWWMLLEKRKIKCWNVKMLWCCRLNQKNKTHHYMDVLYFSDASVHCVIHWQPQVNEKVFVGHTCQFHEWYGITVIKTAFIFICLQNHITVTDHYTQRHSNVIYLDTYMHAKCSHAGLL